MQRRPSRRPSLAAPLVVGPADGSAEPALGDEPALVGELTPGAGERLALHLFAEALTGRLVIDGVDGPSTLYFLRGDPVHVEPSRAPPAIVRLLVDAKIAAPSTTFRGTIARLAAAGIAPVVLLEVLRDAVRDHTRMLLQAEQGRFAFSFDPRGLDDVPLVAVSAFGLVLAARRHRSAPAALLRVGEEMASLVALPRPSLATVASRIRPFTGGADLAACADGKRTVAEIYADMGLPATVGGLVLAALQDAQVLELSRAARPSTRAIVVSPPGTPMPMALTDDASPLALLADLPASAQELLSLYLQLKPETDLAVLFGADVEATPAVLERAWEARLAQLDPVNLAEGRTRPSLLARVEELRAKLGRAHRRLALRGPRASGTTSAFELLDRIGAGGMAEVYRARASEDGRLVAVKRILAELKDDAALARELLSEARLARRIRHPNVVRVLTAGKSGDELYLAMELVDGSDLAALVKKARKQSRRGALAGAPVDVVARIVADASAGLGAAHAARDDGGAPAPILHRDVSTQNVLVSLRGEAKLTDFGIAGTLDKATGRVSNADGPGMLRGKVPYLAPEVVLGGDVSIQSDVYAMGMTLYGCLAPLPFNRIDAQASLRAIVAAPLPPPSTVRSDVPAELDDIVLRACARAPEKRYGSAQELQLDLEQFLSNRAPVDVGAWVRGTLERSAALPFDLGAVTRTVPIQDDVLNSN